MENMVMISDEVHTQDNLQQSAEVIGWNQMTVPYLGDFQILIVDSRIITIWEFSASSTPSFKASARDNNERIMENMNRVLDYERAVESGCIIIFLMSQKCMIRPFSRSNMCLISEGPPRLRCTASLRIRKIDQSRKIELLDENKSYAEYFSYVEYSDTILEGEIEPLAVTSGSRETIAGVMKKGNGAVIILPHYTQGQKYKFTSEDWSNILRILRDIARIHIGQSEEPPGLDIVAESPRKVEDERKNFYHVKIYQRKPNRKSDEYEIKLDLSKEELISQFIEPYKQGDPIVVKGKTFSPDYFERIKITRTDKDSRSLLPIIERERRESPVIVGLSDDWFVVEKGEDVTDKMIKGPYGYRKSERKEEDFQKPFIVTHCPMNFGSCNQEKSIRYEYSERRVFVDIPYRKEYVEYEKTIIRVLERNNLTPVLAKRESRSDILLCKVCRLIHTCNYGIADISYESLNVPLELGLMFGLSKNVILLKRKGSPQPTDIQGKEYQPYSNQVELESVLEKWIKDNIPANGV